MGYEQKRLLKFCETASRLRSGAAIQANVRNNTFGLGNSIEQRKRKVNSGKLKYGDWYQSRCYVINR